MNCLEACCDSDHCALLTLVCGSYIKLHCTAKNCSTLRVSVIGVSIGGGRGQEKE